MAKISIDRNKCKGCLLCIAVCPGHSLRKDTSINVKGVNPVKFAENAECVGCCMCALVCPDCCIEVYT